MLKTVFVAAGAIVLVILAVAAGGPDTYTIERSIIVSAAPERIFPLLVDLYLASEWSALDAEDPAMTKTFGPVTSGLGATLEWDGNRQAGKARLEVVQVAPPDSATVVVDWERPLEVRNVNRYALHRLEPGTRVVWTMNGSQNYVLKLVTLFVSHDRLMGKHFETGLANLKATAEAAR